jgi:hypothetical protein
MSYELLQICNNSQLITQERARNNIPILAAFFSALLRYSSVT